MPSPDLVQPGLGDLGGPAIGVAFNVGGVRKDAAPTDFIFDSLDLDRAPEGLPGPAVLSGPVVDETQPVEGPGHVGVLVTELLAADRDRFLDEGTEFSGEMRFRDVLRIDGRAKGRIVSDNTLIIGETGQVDAEIDSGVVSIRGRVSGEVRGRQRIELLSGCRVQARLVAPKLLIEDGAFFAAPPEHVARDAPAVHGEFLDHPQQRLDRQSAAGSLSLVRRHAARLRADPHPVARPGRHHDRLVSA